MLDNIPIASGEIIPNNDKGSIDSIKSNKDEINVKQ